MHLKVPSAKRQLFCSRLDIYNSKRPTACYRDNGYDSYFRTGHKSHRLKHRKSDGVADVETLRLPFHVCRHIFVLLPLPDIARCMRVCKEWRSLIDTCMFWTSYVQHNYDLSIREPPRKSPLFAWKHRSRSCLQLQSADQPAYLFRPFPDLWWCHILVPYAMAPPQGDIDTHHHFIQALELLGSLNQRLRYHRLDHLMVPCLLPWFRDRMPSSYEVLSLMRAHQEIIHHTQDAKSLNATEMRYFYSIWNSNNAGHVGSGIPKDLYEWIAHWAPDNCILFDGNIDICRPTPCFIITRLAPGWVGGLLYAVGL